MAGAARAPRRGGEPRGGGRPGQVRACPCPSVSSVRPAARRTNSRPAAASRLFPRLIFYLCFGFVNSPSPGPPQNCSRRVGLMRCGDAATIRARAPDCGRVIGVSAARAAPGRIPPPGRTNAVRPRRGPPDGGRAARPARRCPGHSPGAVPRRAGKNPALRHPGEASGGGEALAHVLRWVSQRTNPALRHPGVRQGRGKAPRPVLPLTPRGEKPCGEKPCVPPRACVGAEGGPGARHPTAPGREPCGSAVAGRASRTQRKLWAAPSELGGRGPERVPRSLQPLSGGRATSGPPAASARYGPAA